MYFEIVTRFYLVIILMMTLNNIDTLSGRQGITVVCHFRWPHFDVFRCWNPFRYSFRSSLFGFGWSRQSCDSETHPIVRTTAICIHSIVWVVESRTYESLHLRIMHRPYESKGLFELLI